MHSFDEDTAVLTDLIVEYITARLRLDPVPLDHASEPAMLNELAPSLINEHGNEAEAVLAQFASVLAPAVISCDSPRFLSFIPAAPTKASLLFDMVVSCSSLSGVSWLEAAGAIHAENTVLKFLSDLAGLPSGAGGCFVSGGSAGNLSALVTARDTARRRGHQPTTRRTIAVSEQSHSSIINTANILDVDLFKVDTGPDDRFTGAAFRAALERQPDAVTNLFAAVCTGGTTNAGIVDDFAGVSEVCQQHNLWLHGDCAYGGAALLAPSVRDRFRGIEHVDSFIVDPHKFLFAPFDCAALLYRDPELARRTHTQDASYLDVIHTDEGGWNPTDYAYHLTRRARGLPLWFSLAVHGWGAYQTAIERVLQLARDAAQRIENAQHVELVRAPELSVVVFRRPGWSDEQYFQWSRNLLQQQVAFVTPSKWHGETVARFAFLHPETPLTLVDEIIASMR